ncbi:nitrate- and nitrite sensing domain-containing protein [Microtetraspora sp. AC03309]|uniref:sensor histidine kinase n=1 Tax=Microtetraspora sp. AC03309 TaxID=2779376 RepID=UPI001E3F4D98|nr:nitrate- and nitrite sensing domain-containing protein [Microtetraspora sp. AC03309]MCC5577230.1 nitrate- and nitrite sensing domain-containing protein [Microtetraspora sp. AC03309]
MWGFVLNLTVSDGLALVRSGKLYDTVGVTSTDLGLQLQAERAVAADTLSSGQTTSTALSAQQLKTSTSVDKFIKAANDDEARDSMGEELRAPVDSLVEALGRLTSVRESVTLGKYTRLDALTAYNQIVDELFAVYARMVSVPDLGIHEQGSAMQAMGNAYEMIAREDALIRGVLARGQMSQQEHNAFSEWVATRRFLYQKNRPILEGGMRRPYEEVLTSELFDKFTGLEDRIVDQVRSGGPLPTDAARWKSTTNALFTSLDTARIKASDALSERAASVAGGIMTRIAVAGGVGLIAVIATIIFSVRFGRRLVRDLAGLQHAALELADVRLPNVVERLRRGEEVDVDAEAPPIEARGSSEVEDLAHAFSSVQRTAVEAAVGQAALRRGVNQVFLNLARRKQGLLHRQLTLLDTMQRRASDPESLEDLFRLDHLTTRMRRHAEGLIILSGATPGRSWRKPVAVVDVVRAAIAEVEDYTRITLMPMPNASLAGSAVTDLIHLVAELLENATIFSPPQTRVQVRGELVANGLAIEVEDRGLGLAPEEYATINERLATPPEFDLADSDRLGLFVVSQLASRYGISVVLRASPYGGTTAIILIPRELVAKDGVPPAITGSVASEAPAAITGTVTPGPVTRSMTAAAIMGGSATTHPDAPDAPDVPATPMAAAPAPADPGPGLGLGTNPPASDRSPFFTPAAQRGDPVPSAAREDGHEESRVRNLSIVQNGSEPGLPSRGKDSGLPSRGKDSGLPSRGKDSGLPSRGKDSGLPGRRASGASGTHAGLPRRVRQANIAPQLRERSQPLSAPVPVTEERSPEQVRATFAAFQQGAQRGREDADDNSGNTQGEKGDE